MGGGVHLKTLLTIKFTQVPSSMKKHSALLTTRKVLISNNIENKSSSFLRVENPQALESV